LPRWSTGGPLPRLHVVRRALTNRTTTAGSGRCAESEAAAIVTKVTAGQYVKLQVWTTRCPSLTQADGTRVHAVLGTVASASTCISLRVPARGGLSLEDCVASGSLTPGAAQLLSRMILAKLAFLISGGTGSGNPTAGPMPIVETTAAGTAARKPSRSLKSSGDDNAGLGGLCQ
jgi:hypothetical protein